MTDIDKSPIIGTYLFTEQSELATLPAPPKGFERVKYDMDIVAYNPNGPNEHYVNHYVWDIRPELLPYPERVYLKERGQLTVVPTFILRPVNKLTRADVDELDGRLAILRWLNVQPRIEHNEDFDELLSELWATSPAKFIPAETHYWTIADNGGLFQTDTAIFPQPALESTYLTPSDNINVWLWEHSTNTHPDAFLLAPITDAATFKKWASDTWGPSTADSLAPIFEKQQRAFDALFATYELMRAETFDAIADTSATWGDTPLERIHAAQITAVKNLFFTYTRYHRHPRATDESDDHILDYKNPLRVMRDTATALSIPLDVLSIVQGRRLDKTSAPKPPKKKSAPSNAKTGVVAFGAIKQRTRGGRQTNLLEMLYNGPNGPEVSQGITFDENKVNEIVFDDTANTKLTRVLLYHATTQHGFDIPTIAQKLEQLAEEKGGLNEMLPECFVSIKARDLLRDLYKTSPRKSDLDNLLSTLAGYSDKSKWEAWIYTRKDGTRFARVGPRFILTGFDIDTATMETKIGVLINPAFFWQADKNYIRHDVAHIGLIKEMSIHNDVQFAVLKLLENYQKYIYQEADNRIKAMWKSSKKGKAGKPTPDTIRAARKAIETMCIDKRQFVDDVMLNVPPRNKETASKHGARKSRCNYDYYIQQVERFFDMAIDHGTLIRKYETHPEQKGMWRITFDTSK